MTWFLTIKMCLFLNKNKQLVLTTNKVLSTIKIGKVGETTQHRSSAFNGFYQSEKVYSKDSREVIGYVTVYQDLTTYYMARHVLVLILLVSELIEACLILKCYWWFLIVL